MKVRDKNILRGIHINDGKETTFNRSIVRASPPSEVVIPLLQHHGKPGQPLVKKGERVRKGQKLSESKSPGAVPVHASISGTVTAVEPRLTIRGKREMAVVIKSEKRATFSPLPPLTRYRHLPENKVLRAILQEAGIVGLGGAAFPTHLKLSPRNKQHVDAVILNGCECEPYLTGDDRLMQEAPEKVVAGMEIIMKILKVNQGYIAVEDNKPNAIASLKKFTYGKENLKIIPLKTRYPQGAEKILVKILLGREVPGGGLPADVGVIIHNVETAWAINNAVYKGIPLIEKIVTVTGNNVPKPANFLAPIGISFQALLEQCGGLLDYKGKIIAGGPMMGRTQCSLEVPVTKETKAILALPEKEAALKEPGPCIRCGRCVEHCPMGLLPVFLAELSRIQKCQDLERLKLSYCMECGSCAYVCPAKRPLVQWIRLGKNRR